MPVQVIQGRVSADKALSVLLETELQGLWRDQILLTVPKIKQFFSKSAKEQLKMINGLVNPMELSNDLEQFKLKELEIIKEDADDDSDDFVLLLDYS